MASFDDDRPVKRKPHEIGQDLSLLSAHELSERIELLRAEARRLEKELVQKGSSKNAAEELFRRS